jgi:hypothetical protein
MNFPQMNQFSTLLDAVNYWQSNGFPHSFTCGEDGLRCLETKTTLQPEDLTIVSYHRFEGYKDLGDVSILYVVKGEPDIRGIIVDGYGTYADGDLNDYLKRIPVAESTRQPENGP